jgi:hypothetical protein
MVMRFWYEHHPESAWEVDITEEREDGTTFYNRAMTFAELQALYRWTTGLDSGAAEENT